MLLPSVHLRGTSPDWPARCAPGYNKPMSARYRFHQRTISNKSTTATAIVNCPLAVKQGTNATFYLSYTKKDSQLLTCTLHRRNYDYLSGSTNTESTTAITSFYSLSVGSCQLFEQLACTIPRNNGSGQNNVNGVFWNN